MFEVITGYLEKALKSRQTGSAVSPLLWLNGVVSVPCLLLSAFVTPPISYALFVLGAIVVLFSLYEYRSIRKINPRLLQSEKLQFQLAKLDIVASKGGPLVIDPVNIEFSHEPKALAAPTAEDEQ